MAKTPKKYSESGARNSARPPKPKSDKKPVPKKAANTNPLTEIMLPTADVPRMDGQGTITIQEPQDRPIHWTDGMKAEQAEREAGMLKYQCLRCRIIRFVDHPNDLPKGDEHCSHEFEANVDHNRKVVEDHVEKVKADKHTMVGTQVPPQTIPKTSVIGEKFKAVQRERAEQQMGLPPHLMITARAGTGKTTTLITAMKRLKGINPGITPSDEQQSVWDEVYRSSNRCRFMCFVAFNTTIVKELKSRVPEGVDAKTMHGAGFGAIRKAFVLLDSAVDDGEERIPNIIQELVDNDIRIIRQQKPTLVSTVEKMVDLCKVNLIGWSGPGKPIHTDWESDLISLAYRYEVDLTGIEKEVVDLVPRVLIRCMDVNRDKCITFTDMLWLPVVLDLPMFKFDVLFVDEAQDLNLCQHELIKKMGRRFILCGDPAQSIYGFTGADSNSMPNIRKWMDAQQQGVVDLKLTVTRRCGKRIVEEARYDVPDFKAHESNSDGEVLTMKYPLQPGGRQNGDNQSYELPIDKTYLAHVKPGDMVVCRTIAPLVSQYFKLMKMNVPASIQGKDLAQQIINLITSRKASSVVDLIAKLDDWYSEETKKEQAKRNPRESLLESIRDRFMCAKFFTEEAKTVQDVIRNIENVFVKDEKDTGADLRKVRLMTIHKAKGLEARRVFYLRPAVFPGRRLDKLPMWQRQEEINLTYVAKTRAINTLVYVV